MLDSDWSSYSEWEISLFDLNWPWTALMMEKASFCHETSNRFIAQIIIWEESPTKINLKWSDLIGQNDPSGQI